MLSLLHSAWRAGACAFGVTLLLVLAPIARAESTRTIDVDLKEFRIIMPSTLEAGDVTLSVSDSGSLEHNIDIVGPGIDHKTFPTNLRPGETLTMEVAFRPGTYTIYCPVGQHRARGMVTTVRVTPASEASSQTDRAPTAVDGAEKRAAGAEREEQEPEHQHEAAPNATGFMKFLRWLGNFHPAMVNFPIALLTAGAVAEIIGAGSRRKEVWRAIVHYCVIFGGLSAVAAATLGWFFGGFHVADDKWIMTLHRWLGTSTATWAVLVMILAGVSRSPERTRARAWFRAVLFVGVVLVLTTGFLGGAMLYGLDHYAWH